MENKETDGVKDLSYSVYYNDTVAIENSLLGLVMDTQECGKDAKFVSVTPVKDITETYQLKSGKKMNTVNDCREQIFTFRTEKGLDFDLIVRVYDN